MEALDDLELFLHDDSLPLLIQLGLAHYQFEAIHPFLDGNGRIGRLMIPLMLEYREVLPQPLLYLSAYFERNRIGYYDLLLRTSQKGDVVPWLTFFLRGVLTQAQDAEERTVRRVELQAGLRSALLDERQPRSVVRLGDLLFTSPILNSSVVAQRLDVAAPTAHRAIATLVERGDLVEITGGRRHRVYRAGKIFDAVYGDISPPGDGTDA